MGKLVQKLVSAASFDASGTLVPEGHIGTFDEDKLVNENGDPAPHLHDVGDFVPATVEVSPITVTGPNPTVPQQIPAGAIQGPGGEYLIPGKRLVAEVTNPAEARIDDRGLRDADHETRVNETLADIMGPESTGVAQPGATGPAAAPGAGTAGPADGTVAQVTNDLGTKTDAQLQAILDAENAGQKRKGVTAAVEAELGNRERARTTS